MQKRDLPKVLGVVAVIFLGAALVMFFPGQGAPSFESLRESRAVVRSVQQRDPMLVRSHKRAAMGQKPGSWDIALDIGGREQWFGLGFASDQRAAALRALEPGSEVIALHDDTGVWQLQAPSGALISSYEERKTHDEMVYGGDELGMRWPLLALGVASLGAAVWLALGMRQPRPA